MTNVEIGNTYRLQVTFKTFAGSLSDATGTALKIYDSCINLLTTVTSANLQHPSTGVYYYDYTIPEGSGNIYYEFSGQVEGTTALARDELQRLFNDED